MKQTRCEHLLVVDMNTKGLVCDLCGQVYLCRNDPSHTVPSEIRELLRQREYLNSLYVRKIEGE